MPLVYSYLRFSTPEQSEGDSRRRQLEATEKWCAARGLTLDVSLRMSDEGISAFKGKNKAEGALRDFITKLRNKEIRPGSYLLVEALDRLSREDVLTALGLFSEIVKAGVRLITLQDGMEYTKETIQNIGQLIYSLVIMSTANEESRKKSHRVGEAWKNKKNNAKNKPISSKCPSWIKMINGKFEVIEEKAKVVREIIQMSANGFGIRFIIKELNIKNIKTVSDRCKHWTESIVNDILNNGAAIGHYNPGSRIDGKKVSDGKAVDGYYPAIVSELLYSKSLNALRNRRNNPGRKTKRCANLFPGLVKWGADDELNGKTLVWTTKRKNSEHLTLLNAHGKVIYSTQYKPFEDVMLRCLRELDLNSILHPENAENNTDQIQIISAKIETLSSTIASMNDAIKDGAASKAMFQRLAVLDKDKEQLEEKLQDLQDISKQEISSDNQVKELLAQPITVENRYKIANSLRGIIDFIHLTKISETIIMAKIFFKGKERIVRAIEMDLENSNYSVYSFNYSDKTITHWQKDGKDVKMPLNRQTMKTDKE